MNYVFEAKNGSDETDVKLPVCCVADPISKWNSNSPSVIDTEDSYFSEWTPLQRACRYGQTERVAQYLSDGLDPSAKDALGWNAVPLAVASGNIATVKKILKAARWSRKDLAPALCLAALDGFCEIAEILLESRANPNVPIEDSEVTPLMLAAGEGHVAMVTLLLEHDADPNMTNALHQTALDASVIRGHMDVQNILGPVTHLRSKISSHIPLPISPPNRALQSPTGTGNSFKPSIHLLGASPVTRHCQNHTSRWGSSPMLHCMPISSPVYSPFCLPSGNFVAGSPSVNSRDCVSPFVSPFNFPQTAISMSPCQSHYLASCQKVGGDFLNYRSNTEVDPNYVAKGNKRLKKWWGQVKKRHKAGQSDRNEFLDEDRSVSVAMEKRLSNFLRSIKMIEYHSLFKSQEIDFETFLTLTEEDLEEIGVKNTAHRLKIVEKIKKFSKNATKF